MQAYAAVGYFRWETPEGIHLSFISAKTRVAPLKPMTIPRLELMAALTASRLANSIKNEHNFGHLNTFFWSDSRTVLCWIRSDPGRFKQFVANRLLEIQELTNADDWRWVPTEQNVADDATRLEKPAEFSQESRWFKGPEFLYKTKEHWPIEKQDPQSPQGDELKTTFVGLTSKKIDLPFPDVGRFSDFLKLLRTTAWVRRYILNLRRPYKVQGDLTVEEILDAERLWILNVQNECFTEEKACLRSSKPIPKTSRLYTLMPFLDLENTIRVNSRIEYSELLPYQTKFPVILDPKHKFTKLLIAYYHRRALHQGTDTVINNIRQRYWVLGLRTAVKSVANNCMFCMIRKAVPKPPQMAPLAPCRVNSNFKAFQKTGMDYFGPITVKNGRKTEKRYGVIFTCLAVRGIHIEIAHSMTTDSCLMAIQRFTSVRGCPEEIFSDNGRNLVGASRELKEELEDLDQDSLNRRLSAFNINWRFLPPSSPHMGGAWERLIRSVKVSLGAALTSRTPSDEVLLTLMAEIADIVNSRPLTQVSVDPNDPRAITPNDFLRFTSTSGITWGSGEVKVKKLWRQAHIMADYFWGRWVKQYLPSLTRRNKWNDRTKPVNVGDIVTIVDSTGPRNTWPLGRVVQLYPGRDGQVRVVDVQTADGVYRRPVAKLAILDINNDKAEDEEK